jgi:hypothetical protein
MNKEELAKLVIPEAITTTDTDKDILAQIIELNNNILDIDASIQDFKKKLEEKQHK